MHHRVESLQLLHGHVPQVDRQRRRVRHVQRAQHAPGEQAAVEPGDLVPGRGQDRGHDGAQVALVTGQQNAHGRTLLEDETQDGKGGVDRSTPSSGAAPRTSLRDVEGLGVAGVALHAAHPGEAAEHLGVEPAAVALRAVVLVQLGDLLPEHRLGEREVHGGLGEVAVPLEDLVAEDQVVAERGGHELGERAVVLVRVVRRRREDQVGLAAGAQLLQGELRPLPAGGHPAVGQIQHRYVELRARAERRQRGPFLLLAQRPAAGEDERRHGDTRVGAAQLQ